MHAINSALLGLLLLVGAGRECWAVHDPNFCTLTQNAGVSLPTPPNAYTVSMALTDETNTRVTAMEYFNGDMQKSSFQIYSLAGSFRTIVNFVTNQVQVINLNSNVTILDICQVQNVSSSDVMVPVTLGPKMFILPSKLFFGGGGINIANDGPQDLDGKFPVNSFSSCYYWPGMDTSLKLKWHFNRNRPTEPVRVVADGKDNTNNRLFTLTYDIARFTAGIPPWPARFNPFMAPAGLYCRGLSSQGRKVQALPDRFSMRIEKIDVGSTTATYLREAYDFKSNMSLQVVYPEILSPESQKYGAGQLLYIHDFYRGLSYIRNEDLGNCTYERLSNSDWDAQKDGNKLRIRNPKEFFELDANTAQYKGTGYTRDILTDIFVTYKPVNVGGSDISIMSNATFEWYFANRTTVDPDTKQTVIQSVPLSALIRSDASWLNSWSYIYDFDQREVIFNRHDIAACFSADAKKHFQIYFPLGTDRVAQYIASNPNDFTRFLIPIIALGLNTSPLRVLDPEVTVNGQTAILELTVTEKPKFQSDSEETPLRDIESSFNILLKANSLFTALSIDNKDVVLTANKVTIVEERTSNLKSIGYSAGALVGIGFAMVIIGLAIGVGVIFGIYKYRGGSLMGFDPFQPQRI